MGLLTNSPGDRPTTQPLHGRDTYTMHANEVLNALEESLFPLLDDAGSKGPADPRKPLQCGYVSRVQINSFDTGRRQQGCCSCSPGRTSGRSFERKMICQPC